MLVAAFFVLFARNLVDMGVGDVDCCCCRLVYVLLLRSIRWVDLDVAD